MTFRCPIDGRELTDGAPCPDHGIAFTDEALNRQARGSVAVASSMTRKAEAPSAPRRKAARTRKAKADG